MCPFSPEHAFTHAGCSNVRVRPLSPFLLLLPDIRKSPRDLSFHSYPPKKSSFPPSFHAHLFSTFPLRCMNASSVLLLSWTLSFHSLSLSNKSTPPKGWNTEPPLPASNACPLPVVQTSHLPAPPNSVRYKKRINFSFSSPRNTCTSPPSDSFPNVRAQEGLFSVFWAPAVSGVSFSCFARCGIFLFS